MIYSYKHQVFIALIVVATVTLALIAYQIGNLFSASGKPQPPEWSLDSTTVLRDFQGTILPIQEVVVEPGFIEVKMAYGYKTNEPSPSTFSQDVIAMTKLMCKYEHGYTLKTTYTDKWIFILDWHFVRGLCDGIGSVAPENQLIYEGEYTSPSGEYVKRTPPPQK